MIINYKNLTQIAKTGNIVYARGAFDLLHAGHIDFIEFAKKQGDILVLGIISDNVIRKNKGVGRPIRDENDRARVADSIKGVDYTFIVPEPTEDLSSTEIVLDLLKPDTFVLFDEKEAYTQHFRDLLNKHGTKLVLDKSDKRSSTTVLIEKMRNSSL